LPFVSHILNDVCILHSHAVDVLLFIGNLLLFILKSHSGKLLTESHCYAEQFVNSCPVTNHTINKC